MKIAIIGYGKMGKVIEKMAQERGHEICARFSSTHPLSEYLPELETADVAIEFSMPKLAITHIHHCIELGIPVVVGTTGWGDHLDSVTAKVKATNGSLLHASNFSVGVNLFFQLNKRLAELMSPHLDQYTATMEEIHHTQKLDAPSGTAISLAEQILEATSLHKIETIETNEDDALERQKFDSKTLPIQAKRIPEVPGTHQINYRSSIDEITIKHTAKNRSGFALGSILAAEWLLDKKGVFTMSNVLQF